MIDRPDAYDPQGVEEKWQKLSVERKTNTANLTGAKQPYYNLMMSPYPSAEGLHVGNAFAFIGADINGRVQRLQGKDGFEPLQPPGSAHSLRLWPMPSRSKPRFSVA